MKYLKGGTICGVAVILLTVGLAQTDIFKTCAVPLGLWNSCFFVALLAVGVVYILDEARALDEMQLQNIVRIVIIAMVVIFVWGDLFLMLILADSPKCIGIIALISYFLVMVFGTLIVVIESYTVLKQIIE